MNYVKLKYDSRSYCYEESTSVEMDIISRFLAGDISCYPSSYEAWAENSDEKSAQGNLTFLFKEDDYICLSDCYSQEKEATELKMSRQQFVQLLNDWQEKVCIPRPQEVIIAYENNQYSIQTRSQS